MARSERRPALPCDNIPRRIPGPTCKARYPLTLQHSLARAGKLFPRVETLSRLPDHSLHRYTYEDFYRRARLLAEALQKAGLRRGDRVGTLLWNHYAHLEAWHSGFWGGLQTLNLRLAAHDLAYIANHAGERS